MIFVPLIAVLISVAALVVCILVLSMSVEKWRTFPPMLVALVVVGAVVAGIGVAAASLFHSTVAAVLAGVLCVPASLLAALIAGMRQDHAVKKTI